MIIIGTRFFVWGAQRCAEQMRCGRCGALSNFIMKKGMQFITVFFVIPVFPISGIKHMVQCPGCGARYQATAEGKPQS